MRSARSFSLSIPAKAILVPVTYFEGFFKKRNKCLSDQVIGNVFIDLEYGKAVDPAFLPITPLK